MIGTEAPVQEKIVADLAGVGWRPVSRAEMTKLRSGRMGEPLVEPLLVDGLRRSNEALTEQEALQVVDHLRRATDSETFLAAVRDGVDITFTAEDATRHISIVDWFEPKNNIYVVTTEFELKAGTMREPRLDVVGLVNGIPLAVVETKAWTHDWTEAVRDLRNYWVDAPGLEKYVAVCIATNGWRFRVAPSAAKRSREYAEWKDPWPHAMPPESEHGELEIGLLSFLDPHILVDLAANFVAFETREGITTKKLARYQQFRGANKVVRRVLEGKYDRGLIWHTQGSGKSLTMLFAARKLKRIGLGNPTIFIVIDRVDLDDQINETFTAASFEGVERAFTRAKLRQLLEQDTRGVIITTVQKFDETMSQLVGRENVIALVDEAHRSQEGLYGIRMRDALPTAKLFAFTGTPVESNDRSTRRAFSPEIDGKYENYLDIYTPKQAVEDKATVEVRYEPRLAEVAQLTGKELDKSFEALADDLADEEKEKLKADAVRLGVVAKAPHRVKAVAQDVVKYVRERTEPQGFKAQLVAVDRPACALYAEALLDAGMKSEEIAVIFTPNEKKDDLQLRRWYASEQMRRVGSAAKSETSEVDEESELAPAEAIARRELISHFKGPEHPLKILIVTDMLLTGFDAPIEQVMFLDKPLRGAKLLQAIMRTNRPYPEKNKDRGIIVDYWGVFERLQEAFAEFDPDEVELAVLDLQALRENFPVLLAETLALVAGLPKATGEYEQMMWLLRRFSDDPRSADLFEERFQAVQSAYESLAPEAVLAPYLDDYRTLVRLRALYHHGARLGEADSNFDIVDYRPHTHALVRDAVSKVKLRDDLPVYRIDGSYVERIKDAPGTPDEKAAEVEAAIEFEARERGEDDPIGRTLVERLERLRQKKAEADAEMLSLLDEYLELAAEWAAEKEAHAALGLSERAQGFLSLTKTNAPELAQERAVEVARQLDEIVQTNATFAEWAERDDVVRDIRLGVIRLLAGAEDTRQLVKAQTGYVDEVLTVATAREAVEA